MSLETDLQSYLASLASPVPVQLDYSSTDKTEPRVWFRRREETTELLLAGNGTALTESVYEVEINGLDPDVTGSIADTMKLTLNGLRGKIGNTRLLGTFVEDASGDFAYRGLSADDGYHTFAFNLRIMS